MGDRFSSETQIEVFTAAIILLLNIWGGTRSGLGLSTDSAKEMADVQRCMQVLSECEKTWPSAGKLWDALSDLANVEQVPLPANVGTKNKRDRGAEEPKSATTTAPYSESAHDLVSPPDSSSHSGHAPAPAVTVSRRWTDGPDIVSGVGAEGGRPFAGRRLQTSDVPAIMTQFLPHLQHRSSYPSDSPLSTSSSSLHQSPAYISETPLSSSSLHGQHGRFVSTLRRDPGGPHSYAPGSETTPAIHQKFVPSERSDAQYRRHAPPDSASSVHSPHPPPFVPSMYRADDGHRMPNTPLSASSIQEQLRAPYVPSVNERLNLSYPQSREILDDRTRARGEDYWYSDEGRRGEPSPVHLQHRPMVDNHPPRLSAPGSSSFPMSEAFYEHITASFSAAANGGHGHYEEHPQNQYSDADASIHGIPHGAEPHPHVGRGALDDDAMALWSAAPIGYDTNASEWNTYLDTVNNMAQARMHTGGHGPM
ncbi:hypothetical protein C8R46DRAFT_590446 [Mycena filopes]|nr:hypothetical protein C8R46DRAFT_590446 [Mycena filopes]